MWPFKRKEPKPDPTEKAIAELKAFRDIGETFNYRGIEMVVESHSKLRPLVLNPDIVPAISAAYKNNYGDLKHATFLMGVLPALRAENP